jgi:hypothetical protein
MKMGSATKENGMKRAVLALIFLGLCAVSVLPQGRGRKETSALAGPYLGQKPPGMVPEMFAPGLLPADRDFHSCPVFSKDGDCVFWRTMNSPRGDGVYYMERKNGRWTGPRRARFVDQDADVPYFPYDNQTLFFISKSASGGIRKRRIWFTRRTDGKWEEPKCLAAFDPPIDWLHWQFTFSSRGNIYFTGIQKNGFGDYDLFVATKVGASYSYKILPEPLNSGGSDVCPYCAPDESYLIFCSTDRKEGFGKGDLYICYKRIDGKWTDPVNMGPQINSPAQEWCPMVSKDGRYLFFLSFRSGRCRPYWVSAKIIDALRPKER